MKSIFPFFLIFSFFSIVYSQEKEEPFLPAKNSEFTLVIHGGAGTILKKNFTQEKEKVYTEKLTEALNAGYIILKDGGTSLDAVVAAIKILEDSPLFNAGKGAVLTDLGTTELDASIMDGKTLKAGAVAGIKTVKNPITAARLVMDKSPHVMLAGVGADEFAKQNGLEIITNDYFIDTAQYNYWKKIKEKEEKEKKGGGTVGAVAVDKYGNLAAATSTGGMMNKKFGRVGDSPIIGAGTYANNNTCAVSCTGHGEYFIRLGIAHDVSALMEYKGMSITESGNELIHKKLSALGGTGGLIAVDAKGNIAMPFNTEGMYRGFIKENGKAEVRIYKE